MYERVQLPRKVVLCSDRTLEARAPSLPFPQASLSTSSWTRRGPRAASPSPVSLRSIGIFPVSVTPPEARLLRPPIPGFCFQRNSMFLYSLLKSAANAVLKLMSAVIAIAYVVFVSLKSLSVSIMLLEYLFGKLKYDSTTLPMSGFLGSLPVSSSKSPVSFAILNFLLINFHCGSYPRSRTKKPIDVPVGCIPDIKSSLEAGMSSRPPWAAQQGSSRSVFMYFMLPRSTS